MDFAVAGLSTIAECDPAIAMVRLFKEDPEPDQPALNRESRSNSHTAVRREASPVSAIAQISALEAGSGNHALLNHEPSLTGGVCCRR